MAKKWLILAGVALLAWGCAKKQVVKPSQETAPAVPQAEETKEEPSIRFGDWTVVPQLKIINFEYDKSELQPEAREILKANAEYLKGNSDLFVMVEGHTDERGTTEYNLSLGQRRASAVREYYGQLGVPLGRVGTLSYGEEKPVDSASNEGAWYRNRRAETKVRNVK